MVGLDRFSFFVDLPANALVHPLKISAKSFFLYNLLITPLPTYSCAINRTYVDENKDLMGEGGTPLGLSWILQGAALC